MASALKGFSLFDHDDNVKLWVSRVADFSSQYNDSSWSAQTVIGQPRVYPRYGDIHGAWAQGITDSAQYITVGFEERLFLKKIHIYETFNSGAVKRISVKTPTGDWHGIYEVAAEHIQSSRILVIDVPRIHYSVDELKIEVDCSVCQTWAEIDAVQIEGTRYLCESDDGCSDSYKSPYPPPTLEDLSKDLEELINTQLFSDVTFNVGGKLIYGHKNILSVRSAYFRAMFCDDVQESKQTEPIEIKEVDTEMFIAVLNYLYTNSSPRSLKCLQLVKLWRVADRFSLDGLKKLITCEVSGMLDTDNVVDIFVESSAALPVIDDIKKICLTYMAGNMASITRTASFTELPQELMLEIIQNTVANLKIR